MFKFKNKKFFPQAALNLIFAGSAIAADNVYPNKPVKIIVPYAAGGVTDVTTRLITKKMSEYLGQPFVVENRAGGDGVIGTQAVKYAPPDGYTILATSNGYSITPFLKLNPGYSPLQDFRGIGPMMTAPFIFDVGGSQPYQTIQDFVKHAKAEPSQIAFATAGTGTPNHIVTEIFFKKTGIKNLTHVPFKGAAPAVIEVASGRIPFYVDAYSSSAPYIKSGKIRAIAVTSAKRIPILPDVPTLVEQKIDLTYEYWLGLLVRSGTPENVVQRLSDALRFAQGDRDLQERLQSEGAKMPFMTPSEFDTVIRNEVSDVEKLMSELKIEKQ
jgi:tripartite-type tricarboxylate transporter receptor subunit TctC